MDTLQTDVNIIFAKNDPSLGIEGGFKVYEGAFSRLREHLASNGHHNINLRVAFNQACQNRHAANSHSHWMNPDLSWLRSFGECVLAAREWLTSLGYEPSKEHTMDSVSIRPDYRPGDDEFEADVATIAPDAIRILVEGDKAVNYLVRLSNAALRQVTYWRQQAQTIAPKTAGKAKPSRPTYLGYAVNTATFGHGMFVQVVFDADLDVRRGRLYEDANKMGMQPTTIDRQPITSRYAVEFRIDGGADVARGILQRMLIEMEV